MSAATYRRPGAEARRARTLLFDRLPSTLRERLALSLARGGAPAPLLIDAPGWISLPAGAWGLLAGGAALAEASLWPWGFGDAESALALQPLPFAAAHGAAIFTLLFAVICAARIARGRAGTLFPDGRYLFALDVVEVERDRIRVTELHTLRRVEARSGRRGPSIVLVFADAHEIAFEGQPRAESLAVSLKAEIDAAVALILPDDQPRMERLDPFFELRVSNDWASAETDAAAKRSLLERAPLRALVPAVLVASALAGLGLHTLRNLLSDDAMFALAIAAPRDGSRPSWRLGHYTGRRHLDTLDALRFANARGSVDALAEYLLIHGAHDEEAEDAIFELKKSNPFAMIGYLQAGGPRADRADDQLLALARESNAPADYRQYLEHGKRHADEVRRVLLPEAEYLDAIGRNDDVGPRGAFVRAYPDSAHVPEIKASLHAAYAAALRACSKRKPSAAGLRFVTALLAELEERADPSVNLQINFNVGGSFGAADTALARRRGAAYLPAATHFATPELGAMESLLRAELTSWIQTAFANGTVKISDRDLAAVAGRPWIVITGEPVVVGAFRSSRVSVDFADVRLRVDLHAVLGAGSTDLAWAYTTPVAKAFDEAVDARDAASEKVNLLDLAESGYAQMRIETRQQILDRLLRDL